MFIRSNDNFRYDLLLSFCLDLENTLQKFSTFQVGNLRIYNYYKLIIYQWYTQHCSYNKSVMVEEALLDVTDSTQCHGSATLIAEKIRSDIYNELNLTASAGVAPNKFIAKIASDENKPNGQCVVSPDKVNSFVEQLSLKKIPGIGPKTFQKLQSFGFSTCADVRASSVEKLTGIVGKFAVSLYQKAHGIDNRELVVSRQRKSLAIETTLMTDVYSETECLAVIEKLYPKLVERLANVKDRKIVRQGIKLKFNDFNQTTVEQQSLEAEENIFNTLLPKAHERAKGRGIRLVGLTLGFSEQTNDDEINAKQLSLSL